MLFTYLNVKTKTLKIISLIITLIGIIFILASNHIGNFAIRFAMVIVFVLCIYNFRITYQYSSTKEKTNNLLGIVAAILVFLKPQLTMFIIGVSILILTVPILYKVIKNKDYSDVFMVAISSIGSLFSVYCILNSKAALNTIIIVIGIAFVILGCLFLFETFNIEKNVSDDLNKNEFGFKDVE